MLLFYVNINFLAVTRHYVKYKSMRLAVYWTPVSKTVSQLYPRLAASLLLAVLSFVTYGDCTFVFTSPLTLNLLPEH